MSTFLNKILRICIQNLTFFRRLYRMPLMGVPHAIQMAGSYLRLAYLRMIKPYFSSPSNYFSRFKATLDKFSRPKRFALFGGIFLMVAAGLFLVVQLAFSGLFSPRSHFIDTKEMSKYIDINDSSLVKVNGDKYTLTEKGLESFIDAQRAAKVASMTKEEKAKYTKQAEDTISKNNYTKTYSQAFIDAKGGKLEAGNIQIIFPESSVDEPIIATFKASSKQAQPANMVGLIYELTAHTIFGDEVTSFNKDLQISTRLTSNDSKAENLQSLSIYYLNEETYNWDEITSQLDAKTQILTAVTNHFSLYTLAAEPPIPPDPPDYAQQYCGLMVDDSTTSDETYNREECFESFGIWETQETGVLNTSLLSYSHMPFLSEAIWVPAYKELTGPMEVFVTVPPIPPNDLFSMSEVVQYVVIDMNGVQEVYVNQAEEAGNVVSLGTFQFDGENVAGIYTNNYNTMFELDPFILRVVDAACWGECPEGIGDLTPPLIEDVKDDTINGSLLIEAKITDVGSGVAEAYVLLNGVKYPMTADGDIYSVLIPGVAGQQLSWQIVAIDGSGNKAIWDPTRGYITRGSLSFGLGIPTWAFYMAKQQGYNPARAGSDFCNQYCGDPINTQNGNFYEEIQVAKIPGRPEIDFKISHNSQGESMTIFGESWNHSYNYYLTEYDNVSFQGVTVTYPDGRLVTFTGSSLTPESGVFETLTKTADGYTLAFKDLSEVYFNTDGNPVRIEDPNDNALTLTYGNVTPFVNMSELISIKADGGREITFDYNDNGLVSQMNAPEGKVYKFSYSGEDDLIEITDGNSGIAKYQYENHAATVKTTPKGHNAYANTYDSERRVTKQVAGATYTQNYAYLSGQTVVTDLNSTSATYNYNSDNLLSSLVDENGETMTYDYNSDKKVIKLTDPEGNITEYNYDSDGNQIYEKDAAGFETNRTFDTTFNKPLSEEYKDADHKTKWEYDSKGNLLKVINAYNNELVNVYNSYGQLIESYDFNEHKTEFKYSPEGDLIEVIDAEGNSTKFEYDALGRKIKETNPRGFAYAFSYDQNDNLLKIEGPDSYTLKFDYDANNHLIKETDANGGEVKYGYDTSENTVTVTNQLGHVTEKQYGSMNELFNDIDPEGRVTKFTYTPSYDLKTIVQADGTASTATTTIGYNGMRVEDIITDAEGRVTEIKHDPLYRPLEETADKNTIAATTKYEYTPTGKVSKETDPNSHASTYDYDKLDRLIEEKDAESNITKYKYDRQGNLKEKTNPRGFSTFYEYDKINRLIKVTDALVQETKFEYDPNSNLITQTDTKGTVTKFSYDSLDRMIEQIENYKLFAPPATDTNLKTKYDYDLHGNLLKTTNPRGFDTSFAYDAAHRNIKITDAKGNDTVLKYDKVGNIIEITDREGNKTSQSFDELNRLIRSINAENHKTTHKYDSVGNRLATTDPRNNTTDFSYDGLNRLKVITDPLNATEKYSYDKVGNILTNTDENSHTTEYTYDMIDRLIQVTNPEGHSWKYSYDENSNKATQTDANGNITKYTYDKLDRLTVITDALNGEEKYSYDPVGNIIKATDENGHATDYELDGMYRVIKITDAEGFETKFEYDENGNTVTMIDGNGHAATYEYDKLDNLIKEINAENEKTEYDYDKEENLTHKIDPDTVDTLYKYDKIYRLTKVNLNNKPGDPETTDQNVDTNYSYDENGNLLEIENANTNVTKFAYDPINRQIKETDAEGNFWTYEYDPAGNKTLRKDANGKLTDYSYYPDNMPKKASYQDGTSVLYKYDPNNNRTDMTDSLGSSNWSYDALNRETSVKDALNRTLNFSYDAVGNRTALEYPDTKKATYTYYKNNWMKSVKDPQNGVVSYAKDAVGNIVKVTNPNNTTSTLEYDKVNRTTSIVNKQNGSKTANSQFSYTYNDVGLRTKTAASYAWRTPSAVTTDYQYDNLRRLTKSSDTEKVINDYSYDRVGNRLFYKSNDDSASPAPNDSFTQTSVYNKINQLLTITEDGKGGLINQPDSTEGTDTISYSYDKNGNRINMTHPGPDGAPIQGFDYSYDPENRLASALEYIGNGNGGRVDQGYSEMKYDGLGRRLIKNFDPKFGGDPIKKSEYTYDHLDPVATYNMVNKQRENFYRGDMNRIVSSQLFKTGTQGERFWYAYDAQGSVVGLTKQSGQADHNYKYEDYGSIEPAQGNFTAPHNDFSYTGQEWDGQMGVYEFYARSYDPMTGTWLQQDVYRGEIEIPETLHRYMYVADSPINYEDDHGYVAPLIIVGGLLILDYGPDLYDTYTANRILSDPNSTEDEKEYANELLYTMAAWYQIDTSSPETMGEAILPIDDIFRFIGVKCKRLFSGKALRDPAYDLLKKLFVKNSDEVAELALKHSDDVYKLSKSGSYREKFTRSLGYDLPAGFDVDHMIPEQIATKNPEGTKQALDILGKTDINDPNLLQGIDSSINRGTLSNEWTKFIEANPDASGQEIVDFYYLMRDKYVGIRVIN